VVAALAALTVAGIVMVGVALRPLWRRAINRAYWSLLDYGTSAWRLFGVIMLLMALSFSLVARVSSNFEPSSIAKARLAQECQLVSGVGRADPKCDPVAPRPGDWTTLDALWMTLRYHVPLISAVVIEDWQAADRPLILIDEPTAVGSGESWWPKARDWFGLMTVLNFILWPLFLPFILKRLLRRRDD
jgi:hypothetical protein